MIFPSYMKDIYMKEEKRQSRYLEVYRKIKSFSVNSY
jgi:hypothetical protein